MNYYKSKDGLIYAFDDDQMDLVTDEMTLMTKEEVQQHTQNQSPVSREVIELQRLRAYSDPVHGSDRYFIEAARLRAIGATPDEIDAATQQGIARATEIATLYPWQDLTQ